MFNKRDTSSAEPDRSPTETPVRSSSERASAPSAPSKGAGAVIGPSIHIEGALKGDEDLLIEGKVKGTVELKKNSVTIGESGQVNADIFAHTIAVEGRLEGKLIASERVMIRKSAQIRGTIVAPRVTLEDGAQFNGSIDMDPETDALKNAFSAPAHPATRSEKTSGASISGSADKQAANAPAKSLQ